MKYLPILLLSFLLTTSTYFHEKTKIQLKQSNAREAEAIEALKLANQLREESKALAEEAMAGWRKCAETTTERRRELNELKKRIDQLYPQTSPFETP